MYTMILAATLVSGGTAPDWGHNRTGAPSYSCGGCFGSCNGPAYGGYGGGPAYGGYGGYGCGGYGCYGFNCYGTTGAYGGYGASFYGQGHAYGGHGCYGGWGYYSCYGNWSCYGMTQGSPYFPTPIQGGASGSTPMPPVTPEKGKEPEPVPAPKKEEKKDKDDMSRASLVVEVPEDAKVFIDDQPTRTPSSHRVFQTPALQPGSTYYYVVRAEVVRNGQTLSQSQRVVIRPGETAQADFSNMATTAVATADK